jgi:putative ABC transport system ATP-binding protein
VLIASSGLVKLQDREWSSLNPTARDRHRADHIGYIFQQFNLLGWMNVIDNVILGCAFSPDRKARAIASAGGLERAAMNALEAMQLPASRWRSPGATLSVGEQQRVAAARALIGQPSVILADEPTSALDESLRDPFIGALIEAARQAGSALLLVSHDRALEGRFERRLRLGRAAEGQ